MSVHSWWSWHMAWLEAQLLNELGWKTPLEVFGPHPYEAGSTYKAKVASSGPCIVIYRKVFNIIEVQGTPLTIFFFFILCFPVWYEWNLAVVWGYIYSLTLTDECLFQSRLLTLVKHHSGAPYQCSYWFHYTTNRWLFVQCNYSIHTRISPVH